MTTYSGPPAESVPAYLSSPAEPTAEQVERVETLWAAGGHGIAGIAARTGLTVEAVIDVVNAWAAPAPDLLEQGLPITAEPPLGRKAPSSPVSGLPAPSATPSDPSTTLRALSAAYSAVHDLLDVGDLTERDARHWSAVNRLLALALREQGSSGAEALGLQ